MIKRLTAYFSAAFLMVSLIFGGAQPAHAALSDCLAGYICSWTNNAFGGSLYQWTAAYINSQPGHCLNLSGAINNNISSGFVNAGGGPGYVIWWTDTNCTGSSLQRNTNQTFSFSASHSLNDRFSGIYRPS